MPKKKAGPKWPKLRYESTKVGRWNLCQKLAKVVYQSTLNEHQISENIDSVLENFTLNIKK